MNKLSILIGIGFMLVSALSYTVSPQAETELQRLAPALVGLAIAAVGIRALGGQECSISILIANMVSCFLLIVYSGIELIPHGASSTEIVDMISHLALIVYSMLFVYITRRSIREGGGFDAPIF